jgi:hypothetical protein
MVPIFRLLNFAGRVSKWFSRFFGSFAELSPQLGPIIEMESISIINTAARLVAGVGTV